MSLLYYLHGDLYRTGDKVIFYSDEMLNRQKNEIA